MDFLIFGRIKFDFRVFYLEISISLNLDIYLTGLDRKSHNIIKSVICFNRRIFNPDLCLHFLIFFRCVGGLLVVFDHNLECHVGSQPPSPAVTY